LGVIFVTVVFGAINLYTVHSHNPHQHNKTNKKTYNKCSGSLKSLVSYPLPNNTLCFGVKHHEVLSG